MLPLTAARYPLQKSTTLTCSRRRFPSARLCVRCAKCDGRPTAFCGTFLFLFFSLSLSCKLTSSVPTLRFSAIFLRLRPIFLSLSRSSSLFSPLDCPLSRFALLPLAPLPRTARDAAHTRAPHYQALGSRALHTWLATLTRSVRSYLLQGTVSRGPQAAAARSAHGLCSLVSRAHDSSQRRTERPTADRTLSAKKRACFLSPSFLRLFFFLSSYLFFLQILSLRSTVSTSLLHPLLLHCHRHRVACACTRYVVVTFRRHPRVVSTVRRVSPSRTTCKLLQCCVFTRRQSVLGILGYRLRQDLPAGGPPPAEGRKLVVKSATLVVPWDSG